MMQLQDNIAVLSCDPLPRLPPPAHHVLANTTGDPPSTSCIDTHQICCYCHSKYGQKCYHKW